MPTLLIRGPADTWDTPELSDGLDRYFASYRRVVIDGAGHFPHREASEAVVDEVRAHLRRNR